MPRMNGDDITPPGEFSGIYKNKNIFRGSRLASENASSGITQQNMLLQREFNPPIASNTSLHGEFLCYKLFHTETFVKIQSRVLQKLLKFRRDSV